MSIETAQNSANLIAEALQTDGSSVNNPLILKDGSVTGCEIGSEIKLQWLIGAKLTSFQFSNVIFNNIEFTNVKFDYSIFEKVIFKKCVFKNCSFDESKLIETKNFVSDASQALATTGTTLIGATIDKCSLSFKHGEINLGHAVITTSNIYFTNITDLNLTGASFSNNSVLSYKNHQNNSITSLHFLQFNDSSIKDSNFHKAIFTDANLSNSKILNSKFEQCDFSDIILYDIELGNDVEFLSSNFKDASIDKYSLTCIPEEQLPLSSRVKMKVPDDVAKLRLMYSGIFRVINTLSLLAFIAPYCWFTFKMWSLAKFFPPEGTETITMLGALLRFIASGGESWQAMWSINWPILFIFIVSFIYNAIRFDLLFKTIKLEHEEIVTGLPVKFTLATSQWRNFEYNFIKWGSWGFMGLAILHTIHFMLQHVPVGIG